MGNDLSTVNCFGGSEFRLFPGKDSHGLDTVRLESADGVSSVTVVLWGANVTSWENNGREMLYLSKKAIFDGKKAIRGGIPLVFPQFGSVDGSKMTQHGFARQSMWEYDELKSTVDANSANAVFTLHANDATRALWPYEFSLTYTVTLMENQLKTKLACHNTGDDSFDIQALLHTYLQVPHIDKTTVAGLKGRTFTDQLKKSNLYKEDREYCDITQEVDRIMHSSTEDPDIVILDDSIPIVYIDKSAALTNEMLQNHDEFVRSGKETKSRKAATEARAVPVDVVFWNAWERKCKNLVDMENDGYKHYVCIEPGIITDSCNVPAGQTLILQQNLAGSSLGDALDTKDSDSDDDPEASIRESDL